MAVPKPLFIRYALLTLVSSDTTPVTYNFECSATEIAVTSEGGDVTSISTQCPDGSFSEVNPRTYSLSITGIQDVESDDSLLWFAWEHEGEVLTATFYPKTDAQKNPVGRGLKGTITVSLPDTIGGGEPGNFATMELVFPYSGRPSLVDTTGQPVAAGGGVQAMGAVVVEDQQSETQSEPEPVAV